MVVTVRSGVCSRRAPAVWCAVLFVMVAVADLRVGPGHHQPGAFPEQRRLLTPSDASTVLSPSAVVTRGPSPEAREFKDELSGMLPFAC